MKVDKEVLKFWKKNLEPSDYLKIYKEHSVAPETTRRVLRTGKCIQATYDKINSYITVKMYHKEQFLTRFKS